jgi:hypothetical protein
MKKILSFKSKSEVLEEEKKNRLFFHDLINHSHGILLYLNLLIDKRKIAEITDLEILKQELELFQQLIQDHFQMQHKNIKEVDSKVSFLIFEDAFNLLLKIYFDENVKIKTEYRGDIALFESEEKRINAKVPFTILYRILNNLIKNMAEASTLEISFLFDYGPSGLLIETKNTMNKAAGLHSRDDLANYLANSIATNTAEKRESLGLDSIHELVHLKSGSFNFDILEGQWINTIYIPHNIQKREKIPA